MQNDVEALAPLYWSWMNRISEWLILSIPRPHIASNVDPALTGARLQVPSHAGGKYQAMQTSHGTDGQVGIVPTIEGTEKRANSPNVSASAGNDGKRWETIRND